MGKREIVIQRLIKKGFHLWVDTDGDDGKPLKYDDKWSVINGLKLKQINNRFYLCSSERELYIIDTIPPITAYWVSSVYNFGHSINVQSVENIDNDTYRFILGDYRDHGPLQFLEVHDINFLKKIDVHTECNYAEDLNGNGQNELIVVSEISWHMYWYWIYVFKDGSLINVSSEYPQYYKNIVLKKLLNDEKHLNGDKGMAPNPDEYILKALIHAAEMGGPSAFK